MAGLSTTALTAIPVVIALVGLWSAERLLARQDRADALAAARAARDVAARPAPARASLALVGAPTPAAGAPRPAGRRDEWSTSSAA